ncbi:MAG: RNA 2',3'-cyclic phosphodiesterase [Thermoanaerobaculia bacterium]
MRLFIATTFPPDVIGTLTERLTRVRPKLPAGSWVKPDSQHLTLAFLGEQKESIIGTLEPLMERELAPVNSFDAMLQGCGFFPNPRRARVGWIGVEPAERFQAMAAAVRRAVTQAGVQLDRADFRPHLTIVRIRDGWPPACIETFQTALGDFTSPPFRITGVTLYSSSLQPSGAVHTPLRQFALA